MTDSVPDHDQAKESESGSISLQPALRKEWTENELQQGLQLACGASDPTGVLLWLRRGADPSASALPLGWNALHMLCTYRMARRPDGEKLACEDEDVFIHGRAGPHGWGPVETAGRPWLQLEGRSSRGKSKSTADNKSTRSKGSADKNDRAKKALLRAALRRRSP